MSILLYSLIINVSNIFILFYFLGKLRASSDIKKYASYYYFPNGFSFPVRHCIVVITLRICQSYLTDLLWSFSSSDIPTKVKRRKKKSIIFWFPGVPESSLVSQKELFPSKAKASLLSISSL